MLARLCKVPFLGLMAMFCMQRLLYQVKGCTIEDLIEGNNINASLDWIFANDSFYSVQCDDGYKMPGDYGRSTTYQCFSGQAPNVKFTCSPITCSSPPLVPHATYTPALANYSSLSIVEYTCDQGYVLRGHHTKQCIIQNNLWGVWNGQSICMKELPECESDTMYICNNSASIIVDNITLLAPGRPPTCAPEVANCTMQVTARKGMYLSITVETFFSDSACSDTNYVTLSDGEYTRKFCGLEARSYNIETNAMNVTYRGADWNNTVRLRIEALGCAIEDLIEGSNINAALVFRRPYDPVYPVQCDHGYMITGGHGSASTNWRNSRELPTVKFTCSPVPCSAPPLVPHATYSPALGNYTYLSTVKYTCDQGYALRGNQTLQCMIQGDNSGVWDGLGICEKDVVSMAPSSPFRATYIPAYQSYFYQCAIAIFGGLMTRALS